MNQNNYYSCSSWNYGSYAPCNPCFKQQFKSFSTTSQPRYIAPPQNNYNKFGKRFLPEEERIVTNEYLKEINHIKKLDKSKDSFKIRQRPKTTKIDNNNDNHNINNNNNTNNNTNTNQNNNNVVIKTDTNKYKFRLTYDEWLDVKNKQQMIFNQIKKIKEEEDKKMEKVNMKVDKKYKEIKDKKYKEWLDNKNKEIRFKKQLKLQEELMKEEKKWKKKF